MSANPATAGGLSRDMWLAAAGLGIGVAAYFMRQSEPDSDFAFGTVVLVAVGPVAYAALMQLLGLLFPGSAAAPSTVVGSAPGAKAGSTAAISTAGTKAASTAAGSHSAAVGSPAAGGVAKAGSTAAISPANAKTAGTATGSHITAGSTVAGSAAKAGSTGAEPKHRAAAPATSMSLQELFHLWGWLPNPRRWKPFPWNWLPDPVAFAWGLLEILFIAPICAVCIAVTVPAMVVLKYIWRHRHFAAVRAGSPELVRCFSRPLGRLVLDDPRNHSYIPWMLLLGIATPALFAWALQRHATHGLEFSTLCIYHILRIGPRFQLFAHAHTIVHKAGHCHKGFFRGPFRVFNNVVEWWITPFYGVVPNNYSIAHMKIHHRWHNDVDDVHTNLDLDRTVPSSFLIYTPRFTLYWTGLSAAALLAKRKEWVLLRQLLWGMVVYYGFTLVLFCWNPVFCLAYWVYPHMEACVLLCAISYLWHAFVEESDPGNQYVNSVTILEGHDNVWNEDYHVVHHHAPNCHWTDAPAHFQAHWEQYASARATIFRDTEEGMLLRWLFEKNFDKMAEHFVDLRGELSQEDKKALIMRRLSVVVGETGRDGKRLQREWASTETIRSFGATS